MMTALVKGIEIQGWMREASGHFSTGGSQFHPPGLVGPIGAAVAAGHLLGLDAARRPARSASPRRAPARCSANTGTMTKSTHCGQAASLGLEAAMLAAPASPATPKRSNRPMATREVPRRTFQPDELLNFRPPPFRIVKPGYAIKMFPSQFGTHFVITAGLELHAECPRPARSVR